MKTLGVMICACSLFFPWCGWAQQNSAANGQKMPVFHVTSNLVLLDAIVKQRKTDRLITDLTKSDFHVEEDGVPQKISYFSQDKLPLSVVLLFDVTQTVQPELKELASSALEALKALRPGDEAAVMTFSSSTQLLLPFTTDHEAIAAAIRRAADERTSECTFIDEDVYEAAGAFNAKEPDRRRVLVFFTDGTANHVNPRTRYHSKHAPAYLHTGSEALQRLLRTGVTVSALIYRSKADTALIMALNANPLSVIYGARLGDVKRFAEKTGGPVVHGHGRAVGERMATLIEQIRSRYTLGYVPSNPRAAGTFCRVKVSLTQKAFETHPELRHGHYSIEARSGYFR
ncbi:MAG TPA: VWA domain-containing protein [Terriglobia bacterium]|nr:VWA domain-containing protein [Terriglobia bacterium]